MNSRKTYLHILHDYQNDNTNIQNMKNTKIQETWSIEWSARIKKILSVDRHEEDWQRRLTRVKFTPCLPLEHRPRSAQSSTAWFSLSWVSFLKFTRKCTHTTGYRRMPMHFTENSTIKIRRHDGIPCRRDVANPQIFSLKNIIGRQ